jgi:hypothetical protein
MCCVVWWLETKVSKDHGLKMGAAHSSKIMASNHHTVWHNNLENHEFYTCSLFIQQLNSCISCQLLKDVIFIADHIQLHAFSFGLQKWT